MPLEAGGPVRAPQVLKYEVLDKSSEYRNLPRSESTDRVAYAIVQAVVDKAGVAREPVVLYSPGPAAEAVLGALSKWKFKAANLEGQPCEFLINVAIVVLGKAVTM